MGVAVDGQQRDLGAAFFRQFLHGVFDGRVLDRGGDDAVVLADLEQALDGDVVGLGAGGGEDHFDGVCAHEFGDLFAGVVEHAAGPAAGAVLAAGVDGAGVLEPGFDGDLAHRGGRGVVQVVQRVSHACDSSPAARQGFRTGVKNPRVRAMHVQSPNPGR